MVRVSDLLIKSKQTFVCLFETKGYDLTNKNIYIYNTGCSLMKLCIYFYKFIEICVKIV